VVKYAATIALLSVTLLCITATHSLVTVDKHLSVTLMKLNDEIDEMHRLTLEAGLTAMEARKASVKESAYLDKWNAQFTQVIGDVHTAMITTTATIASIQPVTAAATSTLQTTQATVQALQAPIAALQPVIAHTDALVSDPALTATISNVASTTGHLDATAADVQQEVHSFTHPTWLHKIWGGLLDVAHVFNPL